MQQADRVISVRVPADTFDALKRAADDADRSLAAEVRRVLRAHVGGRKGGRSVRRV
jgi:cell wall assembly regulator SMI1